MKLYRQQINLTQRELASIHKMNSQFVSNWERGLCLPPTHFMKTTLKYKNFPKFDFIEALKEDLIESHMMKYKETKRQKLKRKEQRSSAGNFGINV